MMSPAHAYPPRSASALARRARASRLKTISLTAVAAIGALVLVTPASASAGDTEFRQTNLVSDIQGLAQITDTHLVNPWGMASSPTSPLWVADHNADVTTVYTGGTDDHSIAAVSQLVVEIPGGAPTGQVFNPTNGFVVHTPDHTSSGPARFILASENGQITGWSPAVPPPPLSTRAQVAVDNGAGAVYKGLALAEAEDGTFLYAANFRAGRIDVFDSNFAPASLPGSFTDHRLPAGYAPFNIQALGGRLYVSYAQQDPLLHDDVAGPGHGFLDVFSTEGVLIRRLVSAGRLDSPWGLALAPAAFGPLGGALLVGNFGDGRINAFNPRTGRYLGTLRGQNDQPLVIEGLWGLRFGNGTTAESDDLLFTAGIGGEKHGLLGSLSAD